MSGVVAVGLDPSAAWAPSPVALVVVPVDAVSPAAVPVGLPHPVTATRADPGSVVDAVRAQAPDEALVDAGALGDLAAPVLVALREAGVDCGVRAEGAPALLAAMLEPEADARGIRRVIILAAVAGAGAVPPPVAQADADAAAIARLEAEAAALAERNGELEGAVRGLGGIVATSRIVVTTISPRFGTAAIGAVRRGRDLAAAVDPRRRRG